MLKVIKLLAFIAAVRCCSPLILKTPETKTLAKLPKRNLLKPYLKLALLNTFFLFVSQVDRYKMAITGNGTTFLQELDVNEKENVEVFHVPAHNDVDGASFYHDFKMVCTKKLCQHYQ